MMFYLREHDIRKMKRIVHLYRALFSEKTEQMMRRRIVERKRKEELNLITSNEMFKGIHKGEQCFIIGNGPSIKRIDLSALKDKIVFTVNQSPRIKDFDKIETNYHVWVDESFFSLDSDSPEDMELLQVMKNVKTSEKSPVVFYKTSAYQMIQKYKLDRELDIHYIMDGSINFDSPDVDFPIDRPLPAFPTCIHYAILIAVYMGFTEIVLLGCDCTGLINTINARREDCSEYTYAYDVSDNEAKRMQKQQECTKLADEMLWYSKLLSTYGVLYSYCKSRGCNLVNATKGSVLEELPKVDLKDFI